MLQRRPAVSDAQVADAVAWADSVATAPCERAALFGDGEGDGSDALHALVTSGGCTDASCSVLLNTAGHARVCSPDRAGSGDWIDSVVEHARGIDDPSERLRVLLMAMRSLDDLRRGPMRAIRREHPDGQRIHMLARVSLNEMQRVSPELLDAVELLVDTSPDTRAYVIGVCSGFITGALRRGEVPAQATFPYPRAATVATAVSGQRVATCADFECVRSALIVPGGEETPSWRVLLQGPRARGPALIADTEALMVGHLREGAVRVERHRAYERLLAARMRLKAGGCPESIPSAAAVLGELDQSDSSIVDVSIRSTSFRVRLGHVEDDLTLRDEVTQVEDREALCAPPASSRN